VHKPNPAVSSAWVLSLLLGVVNLSTPSMVQSQAACGGPAQYCHSQDFCVGVNSGFFEYWSLDRPFIDQAKGAGVAVDLDGNGVIDYTNDTIIRNPSIALDSSGYPTDLDKEVVFVFYANSSTTHQKSMLPAGQYVVLWDGDAVTPDVEGAGASAVQYDPAADAGRIEFTLDPVVIGNTSFNYKNGTGGHVTNIRIVPIEFEDAYSDWSWAEFEPGSPTNPPIFFSEWLEKVSSGCILRFVSGLHTNDEDAIVFERDSSDSRTYPHYAVWYQGLNLGNAAFGPANQSHVWPWELIVEATLQTQTVPWLNFRVFTYENLIGPDGIPGTADDDTLVTDVAALFRDYYGDEIYVEYGNELWNFAWPFSVATNHVMNSDITTVGPGSNKNLEENHALRSNAVLQAFSTEYGAGAGNDSCKVLGVLASQARAPWRMQNLLQHADPDFVDVVSAATYVGGDANPSSSNTELLARWNFISDLYDDVQVGAKSNDQVFDEISEEVLTGNAGLVAANWRNDMLANISSYKNLADTNGMCLAFYEGGLHWRLDGLDINNTQHMGVADMMRDFHRSQQLANVEMELNNWLLSNNVGPSIVYSSFQSSGWSTFSYWDWVFEDTCMQAPRAAMIGAYSNGSPLIIGQHPNQAPEPVSVTDQINTVDDAVSLQLVATDPDGDIVSYTATGLPPALSLDTNTGLITGTLSSAGQYQVESSFTDEHGLRACSPVTFQWEVTPSTIGNIGISIADSVVLESDGVVQLNVTLDQASSETVSVDYATDQTNPIEAVSNVDYMSSTGSVQFLPNETEKTVTIPIVDDTQIEPIERFLTVLESPVNGVLISDTAVTEITDDDSITGYDWTIGQVDPVAYGNKYGDAGTNTLESLSRTFEITDTPPQSMLLTLDTFDIDYGREVEVLVNGQSVGYLSGQNEQLITDTWLSIPATALVTGANSITFTNSVSGYKWGIRNGVIDYPLGGGGDTWSVGVIDTTAYGNRYGDAGTNGLDALSRTIEITDSPPQAMMLTLDTFDIDYAREVEVEVNGQSIGFLSGQNEQLITDTWLAIPAPYLVTGTNTITFTNSVPGYKWGIRNAIVDYPVDGGNGNWTVGVVDTTAYGNKYGDAGTNGLDSLSRTIEISDSPPQTMLLTLDTFDIDYATEVEVEVNGQSVGYLSGQNEQLVTDTWLLIPANSLVTGTNTITATRTGQWA